MEKFEQLPRVCPDPALAQAAAQVFRTMQGEDERLRAQEFKGRKEHEERQRIQQTAREQLIAQAERLVQQSETAQREEIRGIDERIAKEQSAPKQREFETDAAFTARLERYSVGEMQRQMQLHRDAVLASTDVQVLALLADPAAITAVFEEALAQRSTETFRRVAAVAEARLSAMAVAEQSYPGTPSPAATALLALRARMDRWRREVEAQSPEAQRQRARDAHALRALTIRSSVKDALQLFGIGEPDHTIGVRR